MLPPSKSVASYRKPTACICWKLGCTGCLSHNCVASPNVFSAWHGFLQETLRTGDSQEIHQILWNARKTISPRRATDRSTAATIVSTLLQSHEHFVLFLLHNIARDASKSGDQVPTAVMKRARQKSHVPGTTRLGLITVGSP